MFADLRSRIPSLFWIILGVIVFVLTIVMLVRGTGGLGAGLVGFALVFSLTYEGIAGPGRDHDA